MQHLRKAGGTNLRYWMGIEVAERTRLANSSNPEAPKPISVYIQERMLFRHIMFSEHGTRYITAIRHPVARALSSYFFEGRWDQSDRRKKESNAINLTHWVYDLDMKERRGEAIWKSLDNYYTQALSGKRKIMGKPNYSLRELRIH